MTFLISPVPQPTMTPNKVMNNNLWSLINVLNAFLCIILANHKSLKL